MNTTNFETHNLFINHQVPRKGFHLALVILAGALFGLVAFPNYLTVKCHQKHSAVGGVAPSSPPTLVTKGSATVTRGGINFPDTVVLNANDDCGPGAVNVPGFVNTGTIFADFNYNPSTGDIKLSQVLAFCNAPLGPNTVNITVDDGGKDLPGCSSGTPNSAVGSFIVNVTPENNPPSFNTTTNQMTLLNGGPPQTADLGTFTDDHTPSYLATLRVISILPEGLSVNITYNGGVFSIKASSACFVRKGNYTISIEVADDGTTSCGPGPPLKTSIPFTLNVIDNPPPTLGGYGPVAANVGETVTSSPSFPPKDPSNDIVSVTVVPTTLSGGGDVSVAPSSGVVTIRTVAGTNPGDYPISVVVKDVCASSAIQRVSNFNEMM